MPVNTASMANTPQAKDDAYTLTEDQLLSSGWLKVNTNGQSIITLNVMSNDLGGAAKTLYSFDDGSASFMTDLLANNVSPGWETTANGNLVRIVGGVVELDISKDPASRSIDVLKAGEVLTDSFVYAIRLANGTLSWATVSVSVTGENDGPKGVAMATLAAGTEDAVYTVTVADLLQGFTDIDGDAPSVEALSADYGSVVKNADGSFTMTPLASHNGPVALSYDVIDGNDAPTDILVRSEAPPSGDKAPQKGNVIATFSTVDVDHQSGFNCSLTTTTSHFALSGNTLSASDDLKINTRYSLTITSKDQDGLSTTQNLNVFAGKDGNDDDTQATNCGDVIYALGSGEGTNMDIVFAGSGDDPVFGQSGVGEIHGGTGNDTLAGGAGNDRLHFGTALNAVNNVDVITDFNANSNSDQVVLSNGVFGLGTSGNLGVNQFASLDSLVGQSTSTDVRVVYERGTGSLYFDSDGGYLGNAVKFATLTNLAGTFDRSDFLLGV